MNSTISRSLVVSVVLFSAALFVFYGMAAGQSAAKGDQWETTSQMSMEGMPMQMPANTVKICAARDRNEPPGAAGAQRNCKNSNFKRDGSKVTWDVQCTGPAMTGTGEIAYSDNNNAYTGAIKFTSAQGSMTINLKGRKLGDCDNPQ